MEMIKHMRLYQGNHYQYKSMPGKLLDIKEYARVIISNIRVCQGND